jgi:hypothetical protein
VEGPSPPALANSSARAKVVGLRIVLRLFEAEACAAAALSHPNIAGEYFYGDIAPEARIAAAIHFTSPARARAGS